MADFDEMRETSEIGKLKEEFYIFFRHDESYQKLSDAAKQRVRGFFVNECLKWETTWGGVARFGVLITAPTIIGAMPFTSWQESKRKKIRQDTANLIRLLLDDESP